MIITPDDIGTEIGKISPFVEHRILSDKLSYEPLSISAFHEYILEFVKRLNDDLVVAGEHRQEQWNQGWQENLDEFRATGQPEALIPKYHCKADIARLHRRIIRTYNPWFDYKLNSYFVDGILFKYLPNASRVIEIGCGTGYHLFRMQKYFPDLQYVGLDWAQSSQDIIAAVGLKNVTGQRFDYFHPADVNMRDAVVFTVASLEQIHDQHGAFLDYILAQRPALVINFEPITEVLDPNNLLDYLTIKYIQKRKYLKDYLTTLYGLQSQGKVNVERVIRLNYGSKFIEGHTCVIWEPA